MLFLLVIAETSVAQTFGWKRVAEVDDVQITVAEVSPYQMRRVRRQHGHATRFSGPSQSRRAAGLAILWRRDDGAYFCNIYVLDLDDEQVLNHEKRHCHGWTHQ